MYDEEMFSYLAPDVEIELRAQWEKDGCPEIESIQVVSEEDEEGPYQYVCLIYFQDLDDDDDDDDEEEGIPIGDTEAWYVRACDKLENGDI
jgi:hypothetical protein